MDWGIQAAEETEKEKVKAEAMGRMTEVKMGRMTEVKMRRMTEKVLEKALRSEFGNSSILLKPKQVLSR